MNQLGRLLLVLPALLLLAGCPAHDAQRTAGGADCSATATADCGTKPKADGGY